MFALSTGSVSVRAENVDLVDDVCHSVQCGGSEPQVQIGAVVASVLLTLGLVATFRHIAEAQSLISEERDRTAAERDAFTEFERQVSGLEATQSVPTGGSAVAMAAGPPDRQLQQVRDAYRETVMSVPHYEVEYDEPIEANMTAELGEEVAAAVFDGTGFTRQLKHGLVSQCNEARRRRAELLARLDREERRLTEASEELRDVEAAFESEAPASIEELRFPDLSDRWERLGDVERQCQDLIEERAAADATRRNASEHRTAFREYVYQPLPTEYPVLSDATRLLDRITERRRSLVRALTRRV